MDPETFEKATGQTKPELDDKIICYCMKGIRSKTAAEQLDDLGYTNVYNYEGRMFILNRKKKAAPGFEPGTPSLRVKCSTTELYRHGLHLLSSKIQMLLFLNRFLIPVLPALIHRKTDTDKEK